MNQSINKDIMLDVLIEQNSDLNKLVKVQEKQILTYEKYVEASRWQVENYERQAERNKEMEATQIKLADSAKRLVKSYDEQIEKLENTVEVQHTLITQLNAQIEELKAYDPKNDSSV